MKSARFVFCTFGKAQVTNPHGADAIDRFVLDQAERVSGAARWSDVLVAIAVLHVVVSVHRTGVDSPSTCADFRRFRNRGGGLTAIAVALFPALLPDCSDGNVMRSMCSTQRPGQTPRIAALPRRPAQCLLRSTARRRFAWPGGCSRAACRTSRSPTMMTSMVLHLKTWWGYRRHRVPMRFALLCATRDHDGLVGTGRANPSMRAMPELPNLIGWTTEWRSPAIGALVVSGAMLTADLSAHPHRPFPCLLAGASVAIVRR